MAGEILTTGKLSVTKTVGAGTISASMAASAKQITMAGNDYVELTMNLTDVEAAMDKGSITTPGYMIVENLSSTSGSTAYIRASTGAANTVEIRIGECSGPFRMAGSAPCVIAATGKTPTIKYLMAED